MSKETPKSCLTSVIWNWSAYYTAAVKSVIDGTWDGSNYYGGMAEGLVEITGLASFAADGTQQKVDEATAEILSGQNNVLMAFWRRTPERRSVRREKHWMMPRSRERSTGIIAMLL